MILDTRTSKRFIFKTHFAIFVIYLIKEEQMAFVCFGEMMKNKEAGNLHVECSNVCQLWVQNFYTREKKLPLKKGRK